MTSCRWNFHNFSCIFTILVKFDIYFLGLPWEIVFGLTTANKLYPMSSSWKMLKIMRYFLNYSGTRFLSTESWKLLNFLMDSVLNSKAFHFWPFLFIYFFVFRCLDFVPSDQRSPLFVAFLWFHFLTQFDIFFDSMNGISKPTRLSRKKLLLLQQAFVLRAE